MISKTRWTISPPSPHDLTLCPQVFLDLEPKDRKALDRLKAQLAAARAAVEETLAKGEAAGILGGGGGAELAALGGGGGGFGGGGGGGGDRTMVMQLWHETAKVKVSAGCRGAARRVVVFFLHVCAVRHRKRTARVRAKLTMRSIEILKFKKNSN